MHIQMQGVIESQQTKNNITPRGYGKFPLPDNSPNPARFGLEL